MLKKIHFNKFRLLYFTKDFITINKRWKNTVLKSSLIKLRMLCKKKKVAREL